MKILLTLSVAIVISLSIMSLTSSPQQSADLPDWLIGTWENKTQHGSVYETWIRTKVDAMLGKSYKLNQQDTLFFETIRVVRENEKLYYTPQVANENDGQPVRFASKSITADALVFENPGHDFPQLISYRKITADSLVASISGLRNGKEREVLFPMRRVK